MTTVEKALLRTLFRSVTDYERIGNAGTANSAEEALTAPIRDSLVRIAVGSPETVVAKLQEMLANRGKTGERLLTVLAEMRQTPQATAVQTGQSGAVKVEMRDRVDGAGVRRRDVTLFTAGKPLAQIAEGITREYGYEFDPDLLDAPAAEANQDGSYTFSIACDAGGLTRSKQKEDFGKSAEEANALVVAVSEALYRVKNNKESLFSFKGKTGELWQHWVRVKEYKATSGYPVRAVSSNDYRVDGSHYGDDYLHGGLVAAFARNSNP